ncbi:hypothetical protein Sjap_006807 [Stephania japonica]|uniref:DUF4283 domain-containing protein n=1 Tax=Stephania japonica TaxID=461633 RepID=A0AAP0PLE7_9MAGN
MDPFDLHMLCGAFDDSGSVRSVRGVGISKHEKSLVGKIIGNRIANQEAFIKKIKEVWHTIHSFKVEQIARDNLYVFHFQTKDDMLKVASGGPWSFDRQLLSLVKPTGIGKIYDMNFSKVAFWIQIHNVPRACMTRKAAYFLGDLLGSVEDVDLGDLGDCDGKFLRLRISIDIDEPLIKGLKVFIEEVNKEVPMIIQYERLPDFCFHCGKIGPKYPDCLDLDGLYVDPAVFKFGDFLLAKPPTHSRTERFVNKKAPSPQRDSDGGLARRKSPNFGACC